jgi:hypothetical protein
MSTLFICSEIESYARCFYELVNFLDKPEDFTSQCEKYGWEITEKKDWIPGLSFSISETEDFSLRLDFDFPQNAPPLAFSPICAVTYYDEDTDTQSSDEEIKELDLAFDKSFFNFLSQMESELGKPSRNETYESSDRTLHFASWEQPSGLLILNQTLGDLHCGIDWEIHILLLPWESDHNYPDFTL